MTVLESLRQDTCLCECWWICWIIDPINGYASASGHLWDYVSILLVISPTQPQQYHHGGRYGRGVDFFFFFFKKINGLNISSLIVA